MRDEARFLDALEKIASALTDLAKIQRERFDREYPKREPKAAVIHRSDDEKREQYSDKAGPEWFEDTREGRTPAAEPSRFEQRYQTDKGGKETRTAPPPDQRDA